MKPARPHKPGGTSDSLPIVKAAQLEPSSVLYERLGVLGRSNRSGLIIVLALSLTAVFAPLLAPYSPSEQMDPRAGAGRPPLTRLTMIESQAEGRAETLLADSVDHSESRLLLNVRNQTIELEPDTARVIGSRLYILGTDRLGRDILSRILYGARVSLSIGLLAALVGISLGVLAGAVAALGGRWIDSAVMRFVDGMLALPSILLIMVLSAVFRPSSGLLILMIGLTGWMSLSRLVRAEILTLKERDFVLAGRSIGLGTPTLFVRHLLPNAASPILALGSLLVGDAILAESALSFLGLGVSSEFPSWGRMIANGRDDLRTLWWISTFPGIAIAVTVLAFALLGDGLRDLLDPTSRRRHAGSP